MNTPERAQYQPMFDTRREDAWWVGPVLTIVGLTLAIGYFAWAGLQGKDFQWGPYHSPLYSPLVVVDWWHFSPAFLIMWIPAGFRATCYYFRKAYYRAVFMSPPACAVGERRQNYQGERAFFIFQNFHRYFLYLALGMIALHAWDMVWAYRFTDGWGMGLGSLVVTLDVAFMSAYVFGCNTLRHLVGGNLNCYSCAMFGKERHAAWKVSSRFNLHHAFWAWVSLFWVVVTDLYIRLLATGVITDTRFF